MSTLLVLRTAVTAFQILPFSCVSDSTFHLPIPPSFSFNLPTLSSYHRHQLPVELAPAGSSAKMATSSVDTKLLKQTKFPPEFNQKVDMTKVNLEVMKKCVQLTFHDEMDTALISGDHFRWIAGKISEILGDEDDVVIELCCNLLEGSRYVCSDIHAPG